ncbi:NAD-binding protein [Sanghuangporus baumii]|uniref:3-oxoacyl-[acyl-carrier-protein] reductase n=1 Tax=Sanghuangporus baumii TaxID=108892 RepID=A0A9Q5HRZ5_SANBA|nr:NAD-binding protein [Sanghuangporus baumii]
MSAELFIHDSSVQTVPFSSFAPRVAVVTGAAQGIGYVIAQKLADDGLDVAVNDITGKQSKLDSVVDELRRKGRRAIAVPGDVSSEADVIYMMVANAYVSLLLLKCSIVSLMEYLPQMVANAGIPAIASFLERTPNLTAYSASKFAVRGLTQTASIELRRHGITANSYAPGYIRTILGAVSDNVDDNIATVKKLFGAPDAPVSEADTVASIVSYLAKPEAYFINGQSINVDGGLRYD